MKMAVSSPVVIISLSALAMGIMCCVLVCCRKRCDTKCGKFLGRKKRDPETDGALDYSAMNRARFASIKNENERRQSIKGINGNVLTTISRNQSMPALERTPSCTFERQDSAGNGGQTRQTMRGEMERRHSIKVPKHLEKLGLPNREAVARQSRGRMHKSMTTSDLGNISSMDRSSSEKRQMRARSRSLSVDPALIHGSNIFSISNQTKPIQAQSSIPREHMRNGVNNRPLPVRPRRSSDSGEHAHQKYISVKTLADSCFNYESIPPAMSVNDIYSPPMFGEIMFANQHSQRY